MRDISKTQRERERESGALFYLLEIATAAAATRAARQSQTATQTKHDTKFRCRRNEQTIFFDVNLLT